MKYRIILMLSALVAVSCAKDNADIQEVADTQQNYNVVVSTSLSGDGFQSGTHYEPMTRDDEVPALNNFGRIYNKYRYVLLKHVETKWIIESIAELEFYPAPPSWTELGFNIKGQLPENEYRMELRPGTYRLLALVNAGNNIYNSGLYEGMVVKDEQDPSVMAPAAAKYPYLSGTYMTKPGQVSLPREVFAGVQDFTVTKQQDLHTSVNPLKIEIEATRRSTRFSIFYQESDAMIREYPIDYTISHYTEFDLYAEEGHRFCEGVDVFGDPYYSETPRTSILTRQTTGTGFHTAANGKRYMIPVVNSTIYGSFFYTDESVEGVPYTITGINTTMRQNTPEYEYPYEVSGMVLRHNTPDAISFSATDDWYLRTSDRMQIFYLVFPEDENNNREQAAFLFDPDYEWSL